MLALGGASCCVLLEPSAEEMCVLHDLGAGEAVSSGAVGAPRPSRSPPSERSSAPKPAPSPAVSPVSSPDEE